MPKKPKRPETEIHAMILKDVKIRIGCKDFVPAFRLHRIEDDPRTFPHSNWNIASVEKADTWKPDCAQAFDEAVARARRSYDIAWT